MSNKFMEKNAEWIINLSREFAWKILYLYKFRDIDEVTSKVMEVISTKCGDIVYNLATKPEALKASLFNKCKNYLNAYKQYYFFEISTDFQEKFNSNKRFSANNKESNKEETKIDLNEWNVNEEEQNILYMLLDYIEQGYDKIEAFEIVAEKMNLEIELFFRKLDNIKQKNQYIEEQKMKKNYNRNYNKKEIEER